VSDNNNSTMSFDRMRSMLMRAAEIRDSEQQQIFDALDEIHARLSPLETLGSVRKRLSEMPDRTEVGALADRVHEALSKLEAMDGAISGLGRSIEAIVDRLARPFAQLDGRLEGMAGRFEGVAGRMDGLEDRIAGVHKRIDDLDHHLDKQDNRLDQLPSSVHGPVRERVEALEVTLRGRLDEVDEGVHEHLDGNRESIQRSVTDGSEAISRTVAETRDGLSARLDETRSRLDSRLDETRDGLTARLDDLAGRPAVDPTDKLDALTARLEQLTTRLDEVAGRLDKVEDGFTGKLNDLAGAVEQRLDRIDGTLSNRPDVDHLVSLVRSANEESELRHAGQLDEAMATFAELILGGGPAAAAPPPPPRPAQRRPRKAKVPVARDGEEADAVEADAR
jgi:ABC-type transporter Mla subunit MlaD